MHRVSSSLTLFFAIFLPVFWMVTMGCFALFSLLTEDEDIPLRDPQQFRVILLLLFAAGGLIIYIFFMRLRRVECTNEHLFVTNYFKTIKISWSEVEEITYRSFFFIKTARIKLSFKSHFGKTIRLLTDEDKIKIIQILQDQSRSLH